ncbi:response regulator transcription factor [Ruegeria sp. 2205SS24-7]|uniref:response regulator transcription factor n=1 Tax=Ruegeria discodermiae TaxID=3064389 RepID=UPI0027413043|nr:response regulator transcription factor [Ruegeria sp. 2205SS24-7]MDP5217023.1 response regulator transcription factor [Ruegeria sp. 2205SS24-7]
MASRLLIIDDDPKITSALVRGLTLHGYAAEAENRADKALERLQREEFAGAIVDVMLGADSGIDLVRAARASGVALPILMLSALSDVEDRAAGLEAGADDYVVKPFSFDELVARLRVQEQRAQAQRPEPARIIPESRTVSAGDASVTLTEREFALLALLTRNAGQPIPRGDIFDTLWLGEGSSNENVVDVYIGYLRKKLSAEDFGFEIKTLRNQGFCLEGRLPVHESD